jgi:micrococcal nuclease
VRPATTAALLLSLVPTGVAAQSLPAIDVPIVAVIEGRASVIDGDTVKVDGGVVRLKGVDAPEWTHEYGTPATNGMRAIVGRWLRCQLTGEKTHGREVGFCVKAAGEDIGAALISQGLALACLRWSRRYIAFEQSDAIERLPRANSCRVVVQRAVPLLSPRTPTADTDRPRDTRPRPPGTRCMYPDDLDSAGRRCGKRAATERPGGL